jgi:hypothetical protein
VDEAASTNNGEPTGERSYGMKKEFRRIKLACNSKAQEVHKFYHRYMALPINIALTSLLLEEWLHLAFLMASN